MPVDDRKMQVVAHRFAFDDFGRLVMFEGQRVPGFRPFEFDLRNVFECSVHGNKKLQTVS
jgi:hypothetical protein